MAATYRPIPDLIIDIECVEKFVCRVFSTGWTVGGSNPGGGEIIRPGAHYSSYTIGTGSFAGVKRPGRCVDHPPPSRTEVKERVELYIWPLLDLRGLF